MSRSRRQGRDQTSTFVAILLSIVILLVFFPVVRNGFVNMDDPGYIYLNSNVINGFTWHGFKWAFTSQEGGFWHPVTWLSIMLDCQLFKLNAAAHHINSAIIHATSTGFLFTALRKMSGATWRSACVAALFGLHPLHVESVVWAAERKDVLSTFFLMLTLWAYANYCANREPSKGRGQLHPRVHYVLALAFMLLGLMTKSMLVTTPVLLLLLDAWPLHRIGLLNENKKSALPTNVLLEKLPFLVAAIFFGIITWRAQQSIGAVQSTTSFPLDRRILNALLSYAIYLRQFFWPVDLTVFYPYPQNFSAPKILVSIVVLASISICGISWMRKRPYFLWGWLWYLIALLPVIGIVQAGGQAHADRYTYVPLIGIFVALVWIAHSLAVQWHLPTSIQAVAALLALGFLTGLTERQIGFWRNSETLFRRALAVTVENEVAHNNLGTELAMKGQLPEAINEFRQATLALPKDAVAHANLGAALFNAGKIEDSIKASQEAIRLNPRNEEAHRNLGAAYGVQGQIEDAIRELRIAVQLNPKDSEAHFNLGFALENQGDIKSAIEEYKTTLDISPRHDFARTSLQNAEAALARSAVKPQQPRR